MTIAMLLVLVVLLAIRVGLATGVLKPNEPKDRDS